MLLLIRLTCVSECDSCREGKTQSGEIGDPVTMLELSSRLLPTLARLFRRRHDLVVETLLRHQLQVALRSPSSP